MDAHKSHSSSKTSGQTYFTAQPPQEQIVPMLNELMKSLCIPIPIVSPIDLTPSLLFAILESLLGQKLPMPSGSNQQESMLKVQKVKLFLGVLETDILREDAGLSQIDPRRLAVGEWYEACFVAGVLCMVGQRLGLLASIDQRPKTGQKKAKSLSPGRWPRVPRKVSDASARPSTTRHSPQGSRFSTPELDTTSVFYASSSTNTRETQITMASLFDDDSLVNESMRTTPDLHTTGTPPKPSVQLNEQIGTPSSMALSLLSPFKSPPRSISPLPTCIHEIPSPSLLLSVDDPSLYLLRKPQSGLSHNPNPSVTATPSSIELELDYPLKLPVRYSGYIEPVNEDFEIASYENSRSFASSSDSDSTGNRSILRNLSGLGDDNDEEKTTRTIAAIHEEYERTLKLLDERAQLLKELADLNVREAS